MGDAGMAQPGYHFVVKALIDDGEGRVLLIRRSAASKRFGGTWDLPGGKVDAGEAFDAALCRETREETGVEVELTGVAGATGFNLPEFRAAVLVMEARAVRGEVQISEEHDVYEWVTRAAIPEYAFSPELRTFLSRVCAADIPPARTGQGGGPR